MLHLLQLLAKYGNISEVKHTFADCFPQSPIVHWTMMAPQLYARLSLSDNAFAHTQVQSLLLRLSQVSPHAIVYETLHAYGVDTTRDVVQSVYESLRDQDRELVQQTELFIREMHRAATLPEVAGIGK